MKITIQFQCATVWWPGREIVKEAVKTRFSIHPSGKIMELKERCPWKEHLLSIEDELGLVGEIKFVVFEDDSGSWRVQGVPITADSFICRSVWIFGKILITLARKILINITIMGTQFTYQYFLIA